MGGMKMKLPRFFLNIVDKVDVGEDRFCPPHYWPHTLPIGERITDERCHYHKSNWRMIHHTPFCFATSCENYDAMMKAYGENKE